MPSSTSTDTRETDNSSVESEDSFVDVPSVDMDFIIKIGVESNGIWKHHRVRLGSLVDHQNTKANGKIRYAKLLEACRSRTPLSLDRPASQQQQSDIEFSYRDVDGDLCVISSTSSLLEAIHQFKDTTGSLKLQAAAQLPPDATKKQGGTQTETVAASTAPVAATESGVADDSVAKRMLRAMRVPSMDQGDDTNPEDFALADSELVRSHLVEQFRDHMNLDGTPELFIPDPREENPYGEVMNHPVFAAYEIEGKRCKSRLFAMDDIYLDLTEKDEVLPPQCVGFAIPALFMDKLAMATFGGPPPELPPFPWSLVPVAVEFDPKLPPKVVGYREGLDVSGNPAGSVKLTQQGNLIEMLYSAEYKHFYRCTGVFEACGTSDGIDLRLIELMVFGAHDDILASLKNGVEESQ